MIELKNYQTIKTLSSLNRWEVRGLIHFMQATYFVSETKKKLFDVLIKYSPRYDDPEMTLSNLYKAAFPNETYDHDKIINTLSDINKLIDYFLTTNLFKKHPFHQKKIEAITFYTRTNFEYFEKKGLSALGKLKYPDIFTGFEKQALLNLLHYYPYEDKIQTSTTYLQNANNSLDEIYIINKLRYQCEFMLRQQTYANQEGFTFELEVQQIAKKLRNTNLLINLYLQVITLYTHEEEKVFFAIKEKFIANIKQLPYYEAATIIVLLTSFTNQQYNKRNASYFLHQQELYQSGLAYKLFLTKGFMPHGDFMNIAVTAIGLKKYTWVKEFAKKHQKSLKKEYQKSCADLVKAFVLFSKEEYGEVLNTINYMTEGVNKQIFFSIRVRFLEIRSLFELLKAEPEYQKPFLSKYRSFYTFLQKKVLAAPKVKAYINHLKLIKRIANKVISNETFTAKEVDKLKQQINETALLIGWEYLSRKVEEL